MNASPFHTAPANTARWLTLVYAVVVAYVTLHPLGALRFTDVTPWNFLFKPWSRVGVTSFDVGVNLAAYVPLGMGLGWILSRSCLSRWFGGRLHTVLTVLFATALGASLATILEGLQSYSPARVASGLDASSNAAGAFFGALLAIASKGRGAWLNHLLQQCIAPHRGALWAVVGLWGLAQFQPQGWAFMTAPLARLASDWLPTPGVGMPLNPWQLHNLEVICSVVALSSMLCLMRLGLHQRLSVLPRALCLLGGLLLVGLWQALAYWMLFGWGEWRLLLSEGVLDSLWFVAAAYVAWTVLPSHWVVVGAVLSLALHTALAQMLPPHPYTVSSPIWLQMRWVHLQGLTGAVSALWPIFALAALVLQSRYRPNDAARSV
jgi:VanZ family protein